MTSSSVVQSLRQVVFASVVESGNSSPDPLSLLADAVRHDLLRSVQGRQGSSEGACRSCGNCSARLSGCEQPAGVGKPTDSGHECADRSFQAVQLAMLRRKQGAAKRMDYPRRWTARDSCILLHRQTDSLGAPRQCSVGNLAVHYRCTHSVSRGPLCGETA